MKKVSISLAGVLFFCGIAFAQLNLSFETWSGTAPDINPDHWESLNEHTPTLGVDGLFVSQDTDASDGSYSARLVTKTCPNCPANNQPNPATGFIEQEEFFSGIAADIDSVKFDYKYIPAAATDTAFFQVRFLVSSGGTSYYANEYINPASTWTTMSRPFLPGNSSMTPDILSLQFFTSMGAVDGIGTDTDGSVLLIDNIEFVYTVGVEESLKDIMNIKVYPNPTLDYIVFETDEKGVQRVDFLDVTGKIVQSEPLSAGQTEIELTGQLTGNCIYIIYAKDGRQMKSGKVLVENK